MRAKIILFRLAALLAAGPVAAQGFSGQWGRSALPGVGGFPPQRPVETFTPQQPAGPYRREQPVPGGLSSPLPGSGGPRAPWRARGGDAGLWRGPGAGAPLRAGRPSHGWGRRPWGYGAGLAYDGYGDEPVEEPPPPPPPDEPMPPRPPPAGPKTVSAPAPSVVSTAPSRSGVLNCGKGRKVTIGGGSGGSGEFGCISP
jgi:hypothetical protein